MINQKYRGLALPLMLLAPTVLAGNIDTIEELIITASPHDKRAEELPGAITVLDRRALQREVSATLGETLQNQPGMHSSSFGSGVGLPIIRGMDGNRVEVLNNGTSVADASATSPDHASGVEPLLADRIEILRGPATLRYGPGAIGGVINVIDNSIHTEAFDGIHGAGEIRHNTNNDEDAFVGRLDGGAGSLAFHLAGVLRQSNNVEIPKLANSSVDDPAETSNGYIANSDAEVDSWVFGLSHVTDNLVAGLSVVHLDNQYGVPPGAHDHGGHGDAHDDHEAEHDDDHDSHDSDQDHSEDGEEHQEFTRIHMEQRIYQGKLLWRNLNGIIEKISLDLNHTDYKHREIEIEDGERNTGTVFDIDSSEVRTEATHAPLFGWMGTLGLQHKRRDFDAIGAEAFVPQSDTRTTGLYLIEETEFGGGDLELGIRHDHQTVATSASDDIDHNSFNASASYLYPLTENQRLGLILSRTERAPAAEELLSNGEHIATRSYEIGDPGLDTESAWNLELTWSNSAHVPATVSLFHRRFSDFIYALDTGSRFSHDLEEEGFNSLAACSSDLADFDGDGDEFAASPECFSYIQNDAKFTGLEAEVTLPMTETQALRLWGDAVRARFDNAGDVPRMPPARLGANWDFASGYWNTRLSITYAFKQDRPGENQSDTEDYTRVDAYVRYGVKEWSVFIKGANLTDEEIRNSTSFLRDIAPEPGRSIVIGANYSF